MHAKSVAELFEDDQKVVKIRSGLILFEVDDDNLDDEKLRELSLLHHHGSPMLVKFKDQYILFGFINFEWKKTVFTREEGGLFDQLVFFKKPRFRNYSILTSSPGILAAIKKAHDFYLSDCYIVKFSSENSDEYFAYYPNELEERINKQKISEREKDKIFKAYQVRDPRMPFSEINLEKEKSFVIRKISTNEAVIFNEVEPNCKVLNSDEGSFLQIPIDHPQMMSDLLKDRELTFLEAIRIATNLSKKIAFLHGKGIIHGDINENNVLLDETKGDFLIRFLDLTASTFSENIENDLKIEGGIKGTPCQMPPEFAQKIHQARSDLYSLLYIFLKLLGVKDPAQFRERKLEILVKCDYRLITLTPYSFEGLLENFEEFNENGRLKKCPLDFDIRFVIKCFLQRMGLNNPNLRPNSMEVLRFFEILEALMYAENPRDCQHFCAELMMLASGLWSEEKYQFLMNNRENQSIVLNLFQEGLLSQFTLETIYDPENQLNPHSLAEIKLALITKIQRIKVKENKIVNPTRFTPVLMNSLLFNQQEFSDYLQAIKTAEMPFLLQLHRNLIERRDDYIKEFGLVKFNQLFDPLVTCMLKEVDKYAQPKEEALKNNTLQRSSYSGSFFGFTTGVKMDTTDLIRETIRTGNTSAYFALRSSKFRRAARQGDLGRASRVVVDYIQTDLRRLNSLRAGK